MTSTLSELTVLDDRSPCGPLSLRRSWPRDQDRLLLEYERHDGATVAGQWFADPECGAEAAAATPGSTWSRTQRVLLQPDGGDRCLTALAGLVTEPGAVLIVHRPERRAVVRRPDRRYAKVVRPRQASRVVAADRLARATGALDMPDLVSADVEAGVLEWAEVPGRSLYDLLHDPTVPLAGLVDAGAAMGRALRFLHRAPAPPGILRHTSEAEVATAAAWVRHAVVHAVAPVAGIDVALDQAAAALGATDGPVAVIHRDLHEKQVMVADDNATLIDFDTLAVGETALDVANVLVHLDLRVALGLSPERARQTAAAFVDAYLPSPAVVGRIAAHAAVTRIRLAGIYAFRPRHAAHAARLLTMSPGEAVAAAAPH